MGVSMPVEVMMGYLLLAQWNVMTQKLTSEYIPLVGV